MRKFQKEQAENFVGLLNEAHSEIIKAVKTNNINLVLDLLCQCQEGAVELGGFIEGIEGEGCATISVLEGYCETVYKLYEAINSGEVIEAVKVDKILRKSLISIENSIRSDIRIRREVVFLPYKASMWDSLESVWKAADEDLDCDAFVIPIPYYDKNPNGTFKEVHYEIDEYPGYVPVMRYEAYDFANRKPDMIFIHNPYDECNVITSVHPFFYSSNLKQFTEQLVYIPYFVCYGKVREHYCMAPAVYNADKVIVQSDEVCDEYKRVFVETVMEEQAANLSEADKNRYKEAVEKLADEKFLGLGSPKYDRLIEYQNSDHVIPKEWEALIGTGENRKKVILFNVHISSIMQVKAEQFLGDIERILDTFKNNRDVVLLWRPHPLMSATIDSMNPAVKERYNSFVDKYSEEGWGIYDDTADLNRAVAVADAYYGDRSSLVELFKVLGKPILIRKAE